MRFPSLIRIARIARAALTFTQGYRLGPCPNSAVSRRRGPSKSPTPSWIGPATSSATHGGQALAYIYFEEELGRRAAARLLTCDEARRIAPTSPSCRGLCGEPMVEEPLDELITNARTLPAGAGPPFPDGFRSNCLPYPANSPSNVLASFRSSVSKPSVNQP
jgi:hypothetical protein